MYGATRKREIGVDKLVESKILSQNIYGNVGNVICFRDCGKIKAQRRIFLVLIKGKKVILKDIMYLLTPSYLNMKKNL